MNYSFILEGENIDGDFLQEEWEFENIESFEDACELAEQEAERLLKENGGGHIDITDCDDNFLFYVEVQSTILSMM